MEISIVIPVYNSANCLQELVAEIQKSITISNEIILINDCSTDDSWNVICELQKKNTNIVGVQLRKNFGQDSALLAGMQISKGQYIVIMDDDLQHQPKDILSLVAEVKNGHDVCFGNFQVKKQSLWKNIGSWINGKLAEIALDKPKHIYLSPFKAISRDVVNEICKYHGPYPYIDGLILRITHSFAQVEVTHQPRYAGRSNYNLIKSIAVWMKHLTGFSIFPLRAASFLGFITASIGFLLALYYIFVYYYYNHTVEGWTTLVCVFLTIAGLILFCLGLIGEYLGRTYLNINQRPPYSIKKTVRH